MTLSRARCTNHVERQASGICPSCSRSYCRECLTEHDGRLTCASCLRRTGPATRTGGPWTRKVIAPAMLMGALLASWFVFYLLGATLEMMTAPGAATTQQKAAK